MLYCESLAILFVVLTASTVIGWRVVSLLPWRLRPESKLFLSPLLGLAVILHLIIPLGWFGHGYRQPVCVLAMAAPVLASLWGRRDLTSLIRNILLVVCFSVVATAGVLYSVWQYGALNPYNDTFTYLVHGQWLQTHGFAHHAMQSGNYPAVTLVRGFQLTGERMGASFTLGYIQALMGAAWSYQVYPAAVAIPVAACALAVAGAAYSACRRMSLSLLCGATIGLTLNGLSYGAGSGFFAQTWGLAFVTGALVLAGPVLRHSVEHSKTTTALGQWIPVALLFSSTIHCYSQISPFLVATMGLVFVIASFPLRLRFGRLLVVAVWLGILCLILVNLEWMRVARSLRGQVTTVVGTPVDWPWWRFLWHAMGLSSGSWDGNAFLLGKFITPLACLVGIGFLAAGLRWSSRGRGNIWRLMPHMVFLALMIMAFVYFRFVVASPWPTGTGQSWSQFKLSDWASPSVFCLLAVGVVAVGRKNLITSSIVSVGLLAILAAGISSHAQLSGPRTFQVRQDTGFSYDPLSAFSKIHQFSAYVPQDVPIYVNLADSLYKPREMLLYALEDHALAGNWRSDGYLGTLPEDQRNQTPASFLWVASMDSAVPPTARRAGNLWLSPCPGTLFTLQSSTGGYDREQDQTGWWHWTARQLHFTYGIIGERPPRVIVSFTHRPTSDHLPVHLSVGGKTFELSMDGGWHNWTSEPIEIDHTGDTIEVVFDCDLPPVRLSERDSRMASYLIKNLMLRRVD